MSIVQLNQVTLHVGGNCLLDQADWKIEPGARIALVGRNGAGKSTLLKLLHGEYVPDRGVIQQINGLKVSGLAQEVPVLSGGETVYQFLVKSLGEAGVLLADFHRLSKQDNLEALAKCQQKMDDAHAWDILPRVEMMSSRLDVNPDLQMSELSGGMKRRALLAAALIAEPDLLLLDEPTNHLDIQAIEWLESWLKSWHGSLVVVTHDREFLNQVATQIVEIDRGKLYSYACSFEKYLDRREAARLAEDKQNDLFDKRLADEEVWIRSGVKARRTRNEGRVRALKAMREAYRARKLQTGKVQSLNLDVSRSGTKVFDVQHLSYSIENKTLIKDFSLLLNRGDKLGIIGPNGCGKTTLIRLLLGELEPDAGQVTRGTSLDIAYFDQLRTSLHFDKTLMYNVADGADYVDIQGKSKHVASYLSEFLFPPERFNQTVENLSGGERNRLLLAKLFAKPVNLLIMDEPTNDLDMETLEMLENRLMDYKGTLLLISHDRAFINQVVTSVIVWEKEGVFNEYVGGYDDYLRQRKEIKENTVVSAKTPKAAASSRKLSYNEQRELSSLPETIEAMEKKLREDHEKMSDSAFYQQDPSMVAEFSRAVQADEAKLNELYQRWEFLEDKK